MESPISPEISGEERPKEKIVRSEKALSDYLKDNPATMFDVGDVKRELLRAIKADVSGLIESNEVFREAIKSKEIKKDTVKKVIIGEITRQRTVSEEEKQRFYELLEQILPENEKAAEGVVSYEVGYKEGQTKFARVSPLKEGGERLERVSPLTESSLFPQSSQLRLRKLDFQPPG